MTTTIRTGNAADLIAAAHYQLGFVPTESLVAAALCGQERRVGMVLRIDLTDAASAADAIAGHMHTNGATAVALLVHTDDRAAATAAADTVTTALGTLAMPAWRVSTTGYGPLASDTPEHPLDDITTSRVAVEHIAEGRALRHARADLLPTPADTAAKAAAIAATERLTGDNALTPAEALALWQAAADGQHLPNPATYGALAAALASSVVRDAVLVAAIPGTPQDLPAAIANQSADTRAVGDALSTVLNREHGQAPGQAADTYGALLAHVIAHTDGTTHATPAWTLWGLIQWWSGNGAPANDAINRALAERPDYQLALLLDQTLSAGLAPGWVARSL